MQFLPVRTYDNYIVANLQLNLLKDQGISCYLQDEHTITIDPLLSPAIGGMKLMVLAEDLESANQVLDSVDEEYLSTVACPQCGQCALEKITHVENPAGFWQRLKNKLLAGSPTRLTAYYHCKNCGYRNPA
jgi:predicted RNA-binding Zn-ribbon protein involved in translation (DUF1610 family)